MDDKARSFADLTVAEFLDALAARRPAPSAGAAIGVSLAMAAALAAMVARYSGSGFADLAEQADGLRHQAIALADADSAAYAEVLRARAAPAGRPARTGLVSEAMKSATEVPCALARLGVEVMALCVRLALEGNPNLTGDARTAAFQASSAVTSATDLVRINTRSEPGLADLLHQASRDREKSLRLRDSLE
ncbi:cyclodeaminase/cyclohydrolase family protein [Pseudonocardia spinosispora]|uniref:cyclodeaminase/cyclohydrolase family protein n=1 Tax=Pseudonocardia spinosispora TaxID=103441 RepID=UPI000419E028|nr:cyclodeaminase/cyclohydrolase family protein [Pseudonocardia spinosispora]